MTTADMLRDIDIRQRKMDTEFATHQEYTKGMLTRILVQTTDTNGKVIANTQSIADLKEWKDKTGDIRSDVNILQNWKNKLYGVWAAVLIGGGILGFALSLIFG